MFPNSNAKMNTSRRSIIGSGGTVLLDGGRGGQSSYSSIDNYIETTGRDQRNMKITPLTKGEGLADKISSKLRNLNIAPPSSLPKRKNISLSI
jgi:hypothetical protein